jgi:Type II secretion system (T2SS), protein E, N-terminal domain
MFEPGGKPMDNDGAAVSTADEWGPVDADQSLEAAPPTTPIARLRPPLASLLVEKGVASKEQLDDALAEAQETGGRVGEVVVRRGWINEAQLADVLASQWKLPFAALSTIRVDPEAQGLMSQEDAVSLGAWPVGFMAGVPLVAVADPGEALFASVRETLGRDCTFLVTTPSALSQLIEENSAPATGAEVALAAEWAEPVATAFEPGQAVLDGVPASLEAEPAATESWPATPEIEPTTGFEYELAAAFEHEPAAALEGEPTPALEIVLPAPVDTSADDESTAVLEELDRLLDRLLEERGSTRDQLVACRQQLEALREDEARLQESIRALEAKATRDEQYLESMRTKLAGMSDGLTAR